MEYQRASLIRGTSLSGLIGERYSAGQGFGGAIRGAISDTLKAKAVGLKERVDPLNIVRQLTGRGAFGNIMTAVAGRALGRSQRDIAYFGGYTRRRSTIPSLESPETGGTGARGSGDNSEMLEKIYQFLKRSTDERKRTEQLNRSFRREQVNEDERRHQDLIDAIKGFTGEPTAKPVKEKEGGFLDMIKSMIAGAIEKFMESFAWLRDLGKLLTGETLKTFLRMIPLLGSPLFLVTAAGAGIIAYLAYELTGFAKKAPDLKQLTPGEAVEVLKSEGAVRDYAARQNRTTVDKLTTEQIEETRKYLKERITSGKAKAEEIKAMPEGIEKEEAIRKFGGKDIFERTLKDTTVYEVPTGKFEGPDKVLPREEYASKSRNGKLAGRLSWDNKFAATHDPATGLRLDIQAKENESETARLRNRGTATAVTPTESTAGGGRGTMAGPTASDFEGVTATPSIGGGRGTMAGPTASDMEGAPIPTPSPIPVPRVVPDIEPMPEIPVVSEAVQPIVQTNTHTNVIGGSKDKILATSTPKQRNTDLNRYLTNNSVAV